MDLSVSVFVMRFLVRTTLLALSLTYAANWMFFRNGDSGEVRVDCGLYSAGKGLGPDGKPFQVTLYQVTSKTFTKPLRVSRISTRTICVSTPSPPPS